MPAPTNISAATAIELGPAPNTIVQTVDFGGTTFPVWYKYTGLGTEDAISLSGLGDLVVYKPTVDCFSPDGVTLWPIGSGLLSAPNKPDQIPISNAPGQVYFLRVNPNAGNPTPAVLTISVAIGPKLFPVAGDILVNDDTPNFYAVVLDPATSQVKRFLTNMPAGEGGAILPSAVFALTGDDGDGLIHIFAPNLIERATVALNTSRLGAGATRFYAAVANIVSQFDSDGAIAATFNVVDQVSMLQASRDEKILYWVPSTGVGANVRIRRHDLIGNVPMTDLFAYPAGTQAIGDLLVLKDGTILVGQWHSGAPVNFSVLHLSAAGAVLQTYDVTASGAINHLAQATNDLTSFWLWSFPQVGVNGKSRYQEIRVSDGAVLHNSTVVQFEVGVYADPATLAPANLFGPSESCPFVVLRDAPCPPCPPCPPGGILAPGIPIGVGNLASLVGGRSVVPIGLADLIGELDMIFGEERFIIPHEPIAVSGASQGFATITDEAVGMAIVTVEGDPIRWLVSGEAPTATDGNLCQAGTVFVIANITNIRNFRCILATGSAAATVTGNFARA